MVFRDDASKVTVAVVVVGGAVAAAEDVVRTDLDGTNVGRGHLRVWQCCGSSSSGSGGSGVMVVVGR